MKKDGFSCIQCGKWRAPNLLQYAGPNNQSTCCYCYAKLLAKKVEQPSKETHSRKHAAEKYRAGKLPPWMFS